MCVSLSLCKSFAGQCAAILVVLFWLKYLTWLHSHAINKHKNDFIIKFTTILIGTHLFFLFKTETSLLIPPKQFNNIRSEMKTKSHYVGFAFKNYSPGVQWRTHEQTVTHSEIFIFLHWVRKAAQNVHKYRINTAVSLKWIRFDVEKQKRTTWTKCNAQLRLSKTNNNNNKIKRKHEKKKRTFVREDKKSVHFFNLLTELRKWAFLPKRQQQKSGLK